MRRRAGLCLTASIWAFIGLYGSAYAQELPVLAEEPAHWILEEISGDAAYEHIRYMTQFHRPTGGSAGLLEVAEYYEEKAREYGLSDVQLIRQSAFNTPWNAELAELWVEGERPQRIASTRQTPLHLADNSSGASVQAELVDVGAGTDAAAYEGKDVRGKVVFAHGPLMAVFRAAVEERGAEGVVWYPSPYAEYSISYPDQLQWSRVPTDLAREHGAFAFVLTLRQGLALRDRLAAEGPLTVRAEVDAAYDSPLGEEPWQVMVEASIRGTEPGLAQDIILTGHLQEEKTSANDDASGTASVLEIARTLNHLIESGRIQRPRRTIRFWWVNEISSQRQYFADNPGSHDRIWVNVNNDMVGADQSQDLLRVQNITRLPATRFHFFNDVVESVIDYMVASNTSELAQVQAGSGDPYPKPHLSRLGSRHRFNAKMIYHHNNTDHMPFNEAPIGVPGVTFTNWPDNYIHSSDDDLWNIDRTQLGRNAASTALIAYTMANAGAENATATALAAETLGRGSQRLARNLSLALSWVATATDPDSAYHLAHEQLAYALEREERAIRSLGEISAESAERVPALLEVLDARGQQSRAELETTYHALTGRQRPADKAAPTAAEQRLEAMRPALVAGPAEFLERRGRLGGVPGLHGIMAFGVLNAVDGQRTGLDIYRYIAAEAREAGAHYYGTIEPEAVLEYLDRAAALELIQPQ